MLHAGIPCTQRYMWRTVFFRTRLGEKYLSIKQLIKIFTEYGTNASLTVILSKRLKQVCSHANKLACSTFIVLNTPTFMECREFAPRANDPSINELYYGTYVRYFQCET